MRARITKIERHKSQRTDGIVYMVCFKCEDGASRNSWIDSGFRNFAHWQGLLEEQLELENLVIKGKQIDADSYPRKAKETICQEQKQPEQPSQNQKPKGDDQLKLW